MRDFGEAHLLVSAIGIPARNASGPARGQRGSQSLPCRKRRDYARAWFVTRAKCNLRAYVCESRPVDKSIGLRCDQTIRLNAARPRRDYPDKLCAASAAAPRTPTSSESGWPTTLPCRHRPATLGDRAVLPVNQTAPASASLLIRPARPPPPLGWRALPWSVTPPP